MQLRNRNRITAPAPADATPPPSSRRTNRPQSNTRSTHQDDAREAPDGRISPANQSNAAGRGEDAPRSGTPVDRASQLVNGTAPTSSPWTQFPSAAERLAHLTNPASPGSGSATVTPQAGSAPIDHFPALEQLPRGPNASLTFPGESTTAYPAAAPSAATSSEPARSERSQDVILTQHVAAVPRGAETMDSPPAVHRPLRNSVSLSPHLLSPETPLPPLPPGITIVRGSIAPLPHTFDGRTLGTQTVAAFLQGARDHFVTNGIRFEETALRTGLLAPALQHNAALWFEDLRHSPGFLSMSWSDIERAFLSRFIPPRHQETLRQQLWDMKQGSSSLTDFIRTFNQVSSQSTVAEADKICIFVNALNKELFTKLGQRSFNSLQEAQLQAEEYAAFLTMVASRDHGSKAHQRPFLPTAQTYRPSPSFRPQQHPNQQKQHHNARGPVAVHAALQDSPRNPNVEPLGENRGVKRMSLEEPARGGRECYNCGSREGHLARDCPEPKSKRTLDYEERTGRKTLRTDDLTHGERAVAALVLAGSQPSPPPAADGSPLN